MRGQGSFEDIGGNDDGTGTTFDFPSTEEIELKYHCHIGEKHAPYRENYRTNYALYILKCSRGGRVKGARCLQGMKFKKNEQREDGTLLPFLSDRERGAVLDYLILGTVQKLLVTNTPYKCSAAKKKIAGIAGYVKIF